MSESKPEPGREDVLRRYEDLVIRVFFERVTGYKELREGVYRNDGVSEAVIEIDGFDEAIKITVKAEWVTGDSA
jgi:hypothetical protein